ncbi:uncharacterized protein LOC135836266 [Planococcus citri]|uniref:uncharacterized protein LOC135836266 n=1 Tax=Planococcus citri TaxID=170843 RepID=UPI0031F97499
MDSTVSTSFPHALQNGSVPTVPTTTAAEAIVTNKSTASIIAPPSGIVMSKNVVYKTINPTVAKSDVIANPARIEIKPSAVQPTLQIRTEDNKTIIISGAKTVNDLAPNVLQQILNNLQNVKPNETVLVINNTVKSNVQKEPVKSYESIVNDVLQSDVTQANDDGLENPPCVDSANKVKDSVNDRIPNKQLENKIIVNQNDAHADETKTKKLNDAEKVNESSKHEGTSNKEIVTKSLKSVVPNDEENINENSDRERNMPTLENDNHAKEVNTSNLEKNDKNKPSLNMLPAKSVSSSSPKEMPRSMSKQKKFVYRLKSKNGRILSYVSDVPIVLKKPVIRLDKMTQADAERLSKQFAAEKKRQLRSNTKLLDTGDDLNKPDGNSTSQKSYGIRTRKRQLKFLPDGRQVKGKKPKRYSSSSSLSSLNDDDLDKPVVTSDEDYHEDINMTPLSSDDDVKNTSLKSTNSKKLTSPRVAVGRNSSFNNKKDIKNTSTPSVTLQSKVIPNTSQPIQIKSVSTAATKVISNTNSVQNKKTSTPSTKAIPNTNAAAKKIGLDPAAVFATLLRIPIASHQLTVRRFKPKISSQANTNNPFMFKKIFSPEINQLIPTLQRDMEGNSSSSSPGVQLGKLIPGSANRTANMKPTTFPNNYNSSSQSTVDPPPLTPISRNRSTFKSPVVHNHISKQSIQEIIAKFDSFTNTRIVKTKEGPKKAKLEELKKADEPKTIYNIMEEIFDSLPHWNIHVIPENKSFCLAQISLGRNGIPALKKSIEINAEFKAKVYIHQLHCRRYDGIYDTESKIRKLIQDVDNVAV